MRGLVYLALTFLAHGYPELARSSGLATARDIVEKDEPVEDRVLWESPGAMAQISTNPFTHGHTVGGNRGQTPFSPLTQAIAFG